MIKRRLFFLRKTITPAISNQDIPDFVPIYSSFGITQRSVAYEVESLANSIFEIRDKFGYEKPILIEEYLFGKDLSVGIIGNPPESYIVLPIIEEDYSMLPYRELWSYPL